MDRKYIVYLTTNLLNQMIYIGIHYNRKEDPYEFDGYFGSNKELKADVRKFGRKNFKRETLFVFDTKEEVKAKERELVPTEVVNDSNTYNKTKGGGGWPVLNGTDNPNYGKRGVTSPNYGKHHTEDTKKLMSFNQQGKNNTMFGRKGKASPSFGKKLSDETKRKSRISHGLTDEIMEQRLFDIKNEPKIYGWKANLSRKWGVDPRITNKFIKKYVFSLIKPKLFEQRLLDIKKEPKVRGWLKSLAKKWGLLNQSAVTEFIKRYAPEYENVELFEQRLLDIENELKVYGWKARLALKWGVHHSTVCTFVQAHTPNLDVSFGSVIEQRRKDIKNISKVYGYKANLSRQWGIGESSVYWFIKKYAQDLI